MHSFGMHDEGREVMGQLGKYSSDRDNILHFMCTSEWANESFGDVESPTGFVWRISNAPADVHIPNTEITSLIEDQLKAYGIQDSDAFRQTLEGHFLITEDGNGFVTVLQAPSESALIEQFNAMQRRYETWAEELE